MDIRLTTVMATALLLLPTVTACQPKTNDVQQPDQQPVVKALYASQQCGRSQTTPSATWIANTRQLEAHLKRIQGTILGSKPLPLPKPDFQHEIALLVEMGQQPTLGYQIALTGSNNLHITQGQARLTLDWVQPPADAMVAQTISSPCLLLKLGRKDYSSVQVLDKQGTIKADTQ